MNHEKNQIQNLIVIQSLIKYSPPSYQLKIFNFSSGIDIVNLVSYTLESQVGVKQTFYKVKDPNPIIAQLQQKHQGLLFAKVINDF